ncbi:rRNA maturation RNase YbeY [Alicyclobacillus mengziensis]|uniref:Endoribonuclease YbeY n=1 Tax=Alicyclobacillus mengziensis TaxID=2931921 RepID=A0A9X7VW09_9BACL|nr:rRNA maturation RNase YbeY [Alicyclobacillus mengziensis]QSO46104.1 rRNA maturation RNase YbeY [Alicyclobacillus mengziensis]
MTTSLEVDLDVRCTLPQGVNIDAPFVLRVLSAAQAQLNVTGEVSVSLVTDEEIHELNQTYRNVDRPTDVLSFALREGDDDGFADFEELDLEPLGDIVISVPTALRQAEEYGHSPEREIGFLLVHGFLHLLGYDHQDEPAEAEMTRIQEQVLEEVGLRRDTSTSRE